MKISYENFSIILAIIVLLIGTSLLAYHLYMHDTHLVKSDDKMQKHYVKIVYGDGIVLDGLIASQIKEKKRWYFVKTEASLLQINKLYIQEITYYTK